MASGKNGKRWTGECKGALSLVFGDGMMYNTNGK